ncbi:MAG: hypothetical protein IPN13_09840 [Bacteroidetes bacterium]|nr:hypothetical protein [Bacteroidota bacterium]
MKKLSGKTFTVPDKQRGGREIERSQYAESVERNNKNYSKPIPSIENDRKLTNTSLEPSKESGVIIIQT